MFRALDLGPGKTGPSIEALDFTVAGQCAPCSGLWTLVLARRDPPSGHWILPSRGARSRPAGGTYRRDLAPRGNVVHVPGSGPLVLARRDPLSGYGILPSRGARSRPAGGT